MDSHDPTTCAEALVTLAVHGRLDHKTAQCILQSVNERPSASQVVPRPLRSRPSAPPAKPKEPEYLYPLGLLQGDLIGQYLEVSASICGEVVLLRGYVQSDAHELSAWLSVRPSYYAKPERPPLLRALAGLTLLNIPTPLQHYLLARHPATELLNAVTQTYTRRQQLRHPPSYLQSILKKGKAHPTARAV